MKPSLGLLKLPPGGGGLHEGVQERERKREITLQTLSWSCFPYLDGLMKAFSKLGALDAQTLRYRCSASKK